MFNLQGSEIIVILLLALVVLGPEKLPDAIRRFTQTYNELKKMGTGFQSEIKSALDEPMREMRATAGLLKDSVDPDRLEAESAAEAELQRTAEAEADRMAVIDEAASEAAADRARDAAESTEHDDLGADDDHAAAADPPPVDDLPAKPINQIAQANARSKIEPVIATADDVDIDAVPTFATDDDDHEGGSTNHDTDGTDGTGDDANEAAVS